MKYVSALTLVSCLMLFGSGCKEETASNSAASQVAGALATPSPSPSPTTSPYSYNFSSTLNGQPCTTGQHTYENNSLARREMCINIQDPVQNNNCALDKRVDFFNARGCGLTDNDRYSPLGYGFNESLMCTITLLDKETVFSITGAYPAEKVLKTTKTCVGRTKSGTTLGWVSYIGTQFHESVFITVKMKFFTQAEQRYNSADRTNASIVLTGGPSTNYTPIISPVTISGIGSVYSFGPTAGGNYAYAIGCNFTWVCDP